MSKFTPKCIFDIDSVQILYFLKIIYITSLHQFVKVNCLSLKHYNSVAASLDGRVCKFAKTYLSVLAKLIKLFWREREKERKREREKERKREREKERKREREKERKREREKERKREREKERKREREKERKREREKERKRERYMGGKSKGIEMLLYSIKASQLKHDGLTRQREKRKKQKKRDTLEDWVQSFAPARLVEP
jgi:hypothetical protein